jgi:hypothetical protein
MQHVYVVVRSDLPFEHQAVQSVHAGIAAARDLIPSDQVHPSLVLCTVPSEADLLALRDKCSQAQIPIRLFVETDLGEQATAFATGPVNGEARKLFKKLPLLKGA